MANSILEAVAAGLAAFGSGYGPYAQGMHDRKRNKMLEDRADTDYQSATDLMNMGAGDEQPAPIPIAPTSGAPQSRFADDSLAAQAFMHLGGGDADFAKGAWPGADPSMVDSLRGGGMGQTSVLKNISANPAAAGNMASGGPSDGTAISKILADINKVSPLGAAPVAPANKNRALADHLRGGAHTPGTYALLAPYMQSLEGAADAQDKGDTAKQSAYEAKAAAQLSEAMSLHRTQLTQEGDSSRAAGAQAGETKRTGMNNATSIAVAHINAAKSMKTEDLKSLSDEDLTAMASTVRREYQANRTAQGKQKPKKFQSAGDQAFAKGQTELQESYYRLSLELAKRQGKTVDEIKPLEGEAAPGETPPPAADVVKTFFDASGKAVPHKLVNGQWQPVSAQ